MYAARSGYTDTLHLLINSNADVEGTDEEDNTALISAAYIGCRDAVKVLLARKANIDAVNAKGQTALIAAASMCHSDVVKILLDSKADVNAKDKKRRTALITSILSGDFDCAKMFLAVRADVNVICDNGDTALTLAIGQKSSDAQELMRSIIEAKGKMEARTEYEMTPLMWAVHKNNLAAVSALIEAKANFETITDTGETLFMNVAGNGYSEVLELLLRAAVDASNTPETKTHFTRSAPYADSLNLL